MTRVATSPIFPWTSCFSAILSCVPADTFPWHNMSCFFQPNYCSDYTHRYKYDKCWCCDINFIPLIWQNNLHSAYKFAHFLTLPFDTQWISFCFVTWTSNPSQMEYVMWYYTKMCNLQTEIQFLFWEGAQRYPPILCNGIDIFIVSLSVCVYYAKKATPWYC